MKIYYVDLPNPNATDDDDFWLSIDTFFSKKKATTFLKERWGIARKYADLFITKGET